MDSDEVRKRKEYAERKVKERHAALRKEAEERRKQTVEHRERVQSVLKREQVLLQKRMQQLNEDEERKKITLAKQHEATSRIAAITKSPKSFAFGSSTPRTLAYLDNLPKSEQQYDKKLRPLEGSSQVTSPTSTASTTFKTSRLMTTPQRAPPAAHRPAPAMTSMTSSMYVTSSAPPTRHSKTAVKLTTTTTSKRLSQGPSAMMTQSVYTPTSRPATSSRLSMGGKQNRGKTPTSSKPSLSIASTSMRRSLDTRKPPMPRKSVLSKPEHKKSTPVRSEALVVNEKVPVLEETPIVENPTVEGQVEQNVVLISSDESSAPVNHDAQTANQVEEQVKSIDAPMKMVEIPKEVEEILVAPEEAVAVNPESNQDDHVVDQIVASLEEQNILVPEVIYNNSIETGEKEIVSETMENEVVIPPTLQEDVNEKAQAYEIINDNHEETTEETPREELIHEETSESHLGSSANTSLADEINIEVDQNMSQEAIMPSKLEVVELNYPLPDEPKPAAPTVAAVSDLVDVFGNDFINQNQPQRIVAFDEDTDSGKASPTSSETSSTTDEVTPRSVIEEVKIAAPRVLPIVRSAEDIARKEKEAREAEERKNRLAAILAKSRGMASPMTNTLPPTAADIKDSTNSPVTSPPTPPSPLPVEQPTSSANAFTEETAEKATNESGRANDVLARVAAMTNSSTLQKILQRKQGSNPSLQTSESTGGEIY